MEYMFCREILNADANVVDLNKLGPFFYEFGTYLLHFEHPESLDIAKSLLQVGIASYIPQIYSYV